MYLEAHVLTVGTLFIKFFWKHIMGLGIEKLKLRRFLVVLWKYVMGLRIEKLKPSAVK